MSRERETPPHGKGGAPESTRVESSEPQSTPEVEVMTIDEATTVTNHIRRHSEILMVYVKRAFDGRAWIALGYQSWGDYCAAEFGDHVHLPRGERRAAVIELRDHGMSTRAIAAATGASRNTVKNDIRSHEEVGQIDPPATKLELVDCAKPIVGTDGKNYNYTPKPNAKPPERHAIQKGSRHIRMSAIVPRMTLELNGLAETINMLYLNGTVHVIPDEVPDDDLAELGEAIDVCIKALKALRKSLIGGDT